MTYLELMVRLLVRFIQGSVKTDKLSYEFYKENARVSAMCCELLENLIVSVSNGSIRMRIIVGYMGVVLGCLRNMIISGDSILQI